MSLTKVDSRMVEFTPAGTGAVVRDVHAKLRESVSVKDFGAVGDGITNDAPAVQLAINAVAALGRGTIVFPPGKSYLMDTQINLCDNLVLWGYGAKLKLGSAWAGINKPLFKNFSGTEFTAPASAGYIGWVCTTAGTPGTWKTFGAISA